jgi:outer membrane lipopolysaccharide assembly protein LptE/RlpB
MTAKTVRSAALIAILALSGACGYRAGSQLPENVQSVAVEVFGNETYYREIEFKLTRELSHQVMRRTTWKLDRGDTCDAKISGRILSVARPTLVESPNDLVSEQAVIVKAEVFLTHRDGRVLSHFITANRAEFIVERGESLETAFAEALTDLAEQIVNRLQDGAFLQEMGLGAGPSARPAAAVDRTAEVETSPSLVAPR